MTITEARQELEAAIAAGGLRVASAGGSIGQVPCVVVVGSEPWLEPSQLGASRNVVKLEAVGLVGGASDPITMLQIEEMGTALRAIVKAMPGWTLPLVRRPGRTEAAGQVYSSVRVETSRIIDMEE